MKSIKGASKNEDFFVSARKRRALNHNVYMICRFAAPDSSTELTPQSRKKTIFRSALKAVLNRETRRKDGDH